MGILSGIGIASKLLGFKDFIVKNWKIVIILVALIGGYLYINGLYNQIEDLQEKNKDVTEQLNLCKDNKQKLQNGINKRNAQIAEWENITRQLEKQNKQLEGQLTSIEENTNQSIEDILNGPKLESCEQAIEYLYNTKDEIQWDK